MNSNPALAHISEDKARTQTVYEHLSGTADLAGEFAAPFSATEEARFAGWLMRGAHALRRNTRSGSRRNIAAHYDLGNDLFELFLDPSLMYSSAVFEREDMTLEEYRGFSEVFDESLYEDISLAACVAKRTSEGGASPANIAAQIEYLKQVTA